MQINTSSLQQIPNGVVWRSLANLVDRFDLKENEVVF